MWIIISSGECASSRKSTKANWRGGHFRPTGKHDIHITMANQTGCFTDVVSTCATSGYDRIVRPLQSIFNGEITGNHVDDVGRNEKGRDFSRATIQVGMIAVFNAGYATDTSSNGHTNTRSILFCDFQPTVINSLATCSHTIVYELVHFTDIFLWYVLSDVEVANSAAKPCTECFHIKMGDGFDTAFPREDIIPGLFNRVSNRRYHAETCYHYPSSRHVRTTPLFSGSHKEKGRNRLFGEYGLTRKSVSIKISCCAR